MPWRTLAELLYILVSALATLGVTWAAAWGYPQGGHVIWPIGLGSMLIVIAMNFEPVWMAWQRDRAAAGVREHG